MLWINIDHPDTVKRCLIMLIKVKHSSGSMIHIQMAAAFRVTAQASRLLIQEAGFWTFVDSSYYGHDPVPNLILV